jgi:AcrR family transcriptional regulator
MPEADKDAAPAASTATRTARQQRRRDRSREEILDAARKVLLSKGLSGMTLEAVAREAGMSKTGLYYYFASKDALAFELVYAALEGHAVAVNSAVDSRGNGGEALGAIVRETVHTFAPNMDDFRLAFIVGQLTTAGGVEMSAEQFERIRPLNDLVLGSASTLLAKEREHDGAGPAVEPRLLAFLAYLSAIGLLTMKGLVEAQGDPLLYSDEQLIGGFAKVFARAAKG